MINYTSIKKVLKVQKKKTHNGFIMKKTNKPTISTLCFNSIMCFKDTSLSVQIYRTLFELMLSVPAYRQFTEIAPLLMDSQVVSNFSQLQCNSLLIDIPISALLPHPPIFSMAGRVIPLEVESKSMLKPPRTPTLFRVKMNFLTKAHYLHPAQEYL